MRGMLGDKHPDTILSIASLTMIYHTQGQYNKVEPVKVEVLGLRRKMLADNHLNTISDIVSPAMKYLR